MCLQVRPKTSQLIPPQLPANKLLQKMVMECLVSRKIRIMLLLTSTNNTIWAPIFHKDLLNNIKIFSQICTEILKAFSQELTKYQTHKDVKCIISPCINSFRNRFNQLSSLFIPKALTKSLYNKVLIIGYKISQVLFKTCLRLMFTLSSTMTQISMCKDLSHSSKNLLLLKQSPLISNKSGTRMLSLTEVTTVVFD